MLRPDDYIKQEHYRALMTDMLNYDLKPSVNGYIFDGILFRAGISRLKRFVDGVVYRCPRFDGGKFISTSPVNNAVKLPNGYWYIDTKSGSRYMIASALQFSDEPNNVDLMMYELLELIGNNINH